MAHVVLVLLLLSSCAFIGPQIASEEEKRAQAILMTEAQAWQKKQEQRILEIAARLISAAEKVEPLKFNFAGRNLEGWTTIDADAVNAWTDGDSVWITRGMMRFLKNDDELAIVLAHEMAHAYRGHIPLLRMKQVLEAALAVATEIFAPGSGRAAVVLLDVATKKFDRDQEREADLHGLIWAHKAGFDVSAAKELWKRMAIEMPESVEKGFLSSHPSSAERFLALERAADVLKQGEDPLKVFATNGRGDQASRRTFRSELFGPRQPKAERHSSQNVNPVAQLD
ncbi:MAG TPA: M48 family metalloprotease [Candidatus Binatia bacterium]|nr:M48 family metalloprotease [Candidatus Binatia bacterium]